MPDTRPWRRAGNQPPDGGAAAEAGRLLLEEAADASRRVASRDAADAADLYRAAAAAFRCAGLEPEAERAERAACDLTR